LTNIGTAFATETGTSGSREASDDRIAIALDNRGRAIVHSMAEQTVIVWDLETVPDLLAAARMLDMGLASEPEVREALGPGFPKHPLHKIVCIGALVASRQPEGWRVDALGAPHTGERPALRQSQLRLRPRRSILGRNTSSFQQALANSVPPLVTAPLMMAVPRVSVSMIALVPSVPPFSVSVPWRTTSISEEAAMVTLLTTSPLLWP
jgi:hypothetical protein